jgi:hypothetical protein
MDARIPNVDRKVSETLREAIDGLPEGKIPFRELLERVGEQGMLILCMFMAAPSLPPPPFGLPGASVPFGCVVVLIGIGVALDRIPWLPKFILNYELRTTMLRTILSKTMWIFERLERLVHPRLLFLTHAGVPSRVNGLLLALAGLLLLAPLPIPGSNSPPAWATLLLSIGLIERDGVFVIAGYLALLATIVFFTFLIVGMVWFGAGVGSWLTASQPG